MPPEVRFAYEHAERALDDFAKGPRTEQFRRAYRKFKFTVTAYAYCDFTPKGGKPSSQAYSHAWEDAQVAFVGHGEPALIGTIMQMWVHVRPEEKDLFARTIKRAFEKAEEATSAEAPRRYMSRWRIKPVRLPEQGFNLPTILPTSGVKLRDWAVDSSEDPDVVSEQFFWLEQADRVEQQEKRQKKYTSTNATSSKGGPPRGGGLLRLVTDEKERTDGT